MPDRPVSPPATRGGAGHDFARPSDLEECRRIHRKFGTTYYFASRGFPALTRTRVDALYAFVRIADEFVDNPTAGGSSAALDLQAYRSEMLRGFEGAVPDSPVLRAFCDLVAEVGIPFEEPKLFLDAMEADLTIRRYETYDDLRTYMRGSAGSVGMMMCFVLGAQDSDEFRQSAIALGEAMQLTNFLRDVGEDAARGRIYIPQEDLARFKISDGQILEARMSDEFRDLMRFEISRARELYARSDTGISSLPKTARLAVQTARILYSRITDRIEEMDYNVFRNRARTTRLEKLEVAGHVWLRNLR